MKYSSLIKLLPLHRPKRSAGVAVFATLFIVAGLSLVAPKTAFAVEQGQGVGDTISDITSIGGLRKPLQKFFAADNYTVRRIITYPAPGTNTYSDCSAAYNDGGSNGIGFFSSDYTSATYDGYYSDPVGVDDSGACYYDYATGHAVTLGTEYLLGPYTSNIGPNDFYGTTAGDANYGYRLASTGARVYGTIGINNMKFYLSDSTSYVPPPPVTDTSTRIVSMTPLEGSTVGSSSTSTPSLIVVPFGVCTYLGHDFDSPIDGQPYYKYLRVVFTPTEAPFNESFSRTQVALLDYGSSCTYGTTTVPRGITMYQAEFFNPNDGTAVQASTSPFIASSSVATVLENWGQENIPDTCAAPSGATEKLLCAGQTILSSVFRTLFSPKQEKVDELKVFASSTKDREGFVYFWQTRGIITNAFLTASSTSFSTSSVVASTTYGKVLLFGPQVRDTLGPIWTIMYAFMSAAEIFAGLAAAYHIIFRMHDN